MTESSQTRVVFLDAATYGDASLRHFLDRWRCTVHQVTEAGRTLERLSGHSVAVTNKVILDRRVLESVEARELGLIAVAATGTDVIDHEAARRRGIVVCNVPGYATQGVAQLTMALILELNCRAADYAELVRNGRWERSEVFSCMAYATTELKGKKLGIVGFGAIGRAVAEMGRGFGMEILISGRPGVCGPPGEGRVRWREVLREADIVTLHCPLTVETKAMINDESLALMKPTSILINTARGGLVDEAALVRALGERRIAGAALDVVSQEPPVPRLAIIEAARALDNLLITPHIGWSARETRERLLAEVFGNIAAYEAGTPRNIVRGDGG